MRLLNVKKTTRKEIAHNWEVALPFNWSDPLYIRCNAKGIVNWDKASIYNPNELIERGNYRIHK